MSGRMRLVIRCGECLGSHVNKSRSIYRRVAVTCVEKAGQRDEGEYIDLGGTLARE